MIVFQMNFQDLYFSNVKFEKSKIKYNHVQIKYYSYLSNIMYLHFVL
jgi:hypothetical protein